MSRFTLKADGLRGPLGCAVLLAGCGDTSSDADRVTTLDSLRVLAVRSTPADVAPGETATLSALVFEPSDSALEYAWSWCPARSDESGNFACVIDEATLRQAWAQTAPEVDLPGYDLGGAPEAAFTNVFTSERLGALCDALSAQSPDPQTATFACRTRLQVSVGLTVRTPREEVRAIKGLVLLPDALAPEQRNTNPELPAEIAVVDLGVRAPVMPGEALQAGHEYSLQVDVAPEVAEEVPEQLPAEGPLAARAIPAHRETLVLSWFMTHGHPIAPDGEETISDNDLTTFVDGENELSALGFNGWQLPLSAGPEDAALTLVLRDERGGVGWAEHSFRVTEAP
jgi:hypothetical protein